MTLSDTEMMELVRKHPTNTHKKRSLIWISDLCHRRFAARRNQQVEEYKHTHTHTRARAHAHTHTHTHTHTHAHTYYSKVLDDKTFLSSAIPFQFQFPSLPFLHAFLNNCLVSLYFKFLLPVYVYFYPNFLICFFYCVIVNQI